MESSESKEYLRGRTLATAEFHSKSTTAGKMKRRRKQTADNFSLQKLLIKAPSYRDSSETRN
jgi:hypothetical protein